MSMSSTKRFGSSKPLEKTRSPKMTLVSPNDGPHGSQKLTEKTGSPSPQTDRVPAMRRVEEHIDAVKAIVKSLPKLSRLSNERQAPFEYLTLPEYIDTNWLDQAEIELKEITSRDNWTPLGLKGAAVFLEQIASALQVEIPERHGAELYLEILEEIPSGPAKRAQRRIVKDHGYKTLPLPSEINKAIWSDEVFLIVKRLENQIKKMRLKLKLS